MRYKSCLDIQDSGQNHERDEGVDKHDISEACSTNGTVRNMYKPLAGKLKEKDDLEDLGIHGRYGDGVA
jgi:hypothetical protein